MEAALARQARLAKPPHSLGKLEDLSVKLAGMTGRLYNPVDRRRLLVFAADNGVVEEGVSGCPKSVTLRQTVNLARSARHQKVLAELSARLDAILTETGDPRMAPGLCVYDSPEYISLIKPNKPANSFFEQ